MNEVLGDEGTINEAYEFPAHNSLDDSELDFDMDDHSGHTSSTISEGPISCVMYVLRQECRHHRVKRISGDILDALYSEEEVMETNIDAAVNPDEVITVYSSLHSLDLQHSYIGTRQLMALAGVLQADPYTLGHCGSPKVASGVSFANTTFRTGFSLLPELRSLNLRGMQLNFNVDESKAFQLRFLSNHTDSDPSPRRCALPPPPERYEGGNFALRHLLASLEGHPSLEELDLSNNPIGSTVLPALSRLLKATPTLTHIYLSGTLLNKSECALIAAQCELNERRLEAVPVEQYMRQREEWHSAQKRWLVARTKMAIAENAQLTKDREEEAAVCDDAVPPVLGTPHIRLVEKPQVKDNTTSRSIVSSRCMSSTIGRSRSRGGDSSVFSFIDINYDDDGSPAGSIAGDFGVAGINASRQSFVFTTPYMKYYLPRETPSVLSPDSIQVARCAFMDPVLAQLTIMRGLQVPLGVPRPVGRPGMTSVSGQERSAIFAMMDKSFLLQAVRRVVLPQPVRPISLFGERSVHDPALRTTAEENYWDTLERQEKQWAYLLDRLVDHMYPTYVTPGDTLYRVGDEPYWLTFVPGTTVASASQGQQEKEAEVSVTYVVAKPHALPVHDGSPKSQQALAGGHSSFGGLALKRRQETEPMLSFECVTTAGQFLGDIEMFGCCDIYAAVAAAAGGAGGAGGDDHGSHGARKGSAGTVNQQRGSEEVAKRLGTAVVRFREEKDFSKAAEDDGSSHSDGAASSGSVRLLQIPLQVAFFYMYDPYHTFHTNAARALWLLEATHSLHPVAVSMLAYLMRPVVVSASDLKARVSGAAAGKAQLRQDVDAAQTLTSRSNPRVCADREALHNSIILVESGDFTLGYFSPHGRWVENAVRPGTVVVNGSALSLDTEARAAAAAAEPAENSTSTDATASTNMMMGKQAALRQYREAQQRASGAAAERRSQNFGMSASSEISYDTNSVRRQRVVTDEAYLSLSGSNTFWRYYSISNRDYSCLPQEVRLALTKTFVQI